MTQGMNPAAPHHLPPFITAPGETDVFLVGCAIFLVVAIISLGSLYFRLHALPEHLAHGKASKLQFEVVAVLALLALFTHNSGFWVAALILAIVPIPDLYGPLAGMADSLAKMAGRRRRGSDVEAAEASDVATAVSASPSPEARPVGPARHRGEAAQSFARVNWPADAGVTIERLAPDVPQSPLREEA